MRKNPVTHFEMAYENGERVMQFYSEAFGWKMLGMGENMGNYILAQTTETDNEGMVKNPGNINGGFFPKEVASLIEPSVVIEVENLGDAIKRVESAGGKIIGGKMDIPGVGMFVSFSDTEGNRAGMLEPAQGD